MEMVEQVVRLYPFWDRLTEEEKEKIKGSLVEKVFHKGQLVTSSHSSCMGLVTILSGDVRVSIFSEDGRQIILFHVKEKENCVMTASCVIRQLSFETVVTATEETTMAVLPAFVLSSLAEKNIYVKAFLYERLTERFSTVVWVMEQILFKQMDQRVAEYLVFSYEKTGSLEVKKTQEEIANEVNSAREVVARVLKEFQEEGYVELKRGRILLRDIDGLEKLR